MLRVLNCPCEVVGDEVVMGFMRFSWACSEGVSIFRLILWGSQWPLISNYFVTLVCIMWTYVNILIHLHILECVETCPCVNFYMLHSHTFKHSWMFWNVPREGVKRISANSSASTCHITTSHHPPPFNLFKLSRSSLMNIWNIIIW